MIARRLLEWFNPRATRFKGYQRILMNLMWLPCLLRLNQQQQQTNINATSTSSSIAVTNVDQPQYYHEPAQYYETTTTIDHVNVTNLPTGLTEQQRYLTQVVVQIPLNMIRRRLVQLVSLIRHTTLLHNYHQLDYFVTDPTAASSPASPSNLDQNHQINDKDQNPLLNFDYTQFYDCDGDDIKLPHRQR
ncbi:hypothetical protein DVH24_040610 [Malus domestica]|uniref:Uncharacterized protein n=1 Tax=Malus domestica TaxID=3750 RepID=A0A498IE53_MALDO|nr:hypothetical protein DVH24_040610 [Malus domestica]